MRNDIVILLRRVIMQKFFITLVIIVSIFTSCASLRTSNAKFILKHNERVVATSFCQAEDKLAILTSDGTITLWDINTGGIVRRVNTNNTNPVNSLVYTETNGIIIIYKNGDIIRYDPMNVEESILRVIPENFIGKFVYYPEGRYFIFGVENTTTTQSGSSEMSFVVNARHLHDNRIRTTEVFNRKLESIGFEYSQNQINISLPTNILRTVDSERRRTTESTGDFHTDMMNQMNRARYDSDVENSRRRYELTSITISPDGIIVCGFYSGLIILYDSKTNREIRRFENSDGNVVTALAFNSNGRYLLSGSSDKIIRLWDRENNWSRVTQRNLITATSLYFSPNGESFIASNDRSFFVISARNGSVLHSFSGSKIESIFYKTNNEIMVIGSRNQSVYVW